MKMSMTAVTQVTPPYSYGHIDEQLYFVGVAYSNDNAYDDDDNKPLDLSTDNNFCQ